MINWFQNRENSIICEHPQLSMISRNKIRSPVLHFDWYYFELISWTCITICSMRKLNLQENVCSFHLFKDSLTSIFCSRKLSPLIHIYDINILMKTFQSFPFILWFVFYHSMMQIPKVHLMFLCKPLQNQHINESEVVFYCSLAIIQLIFLMHSALVKLNLIFLYYFCIISVLFMFYFRPISLFMSLSSMVLSLCSIISLISECLFSIIDAT